MHDQRRIAAQLQHYTLAAQQAFSSQPTLAEPVKLGTLMRYFFFGEPRSVGIVESQNCNASSGQLASR